MTNNAAASGQSRLADAFIAGIAWIGIALNFSALLSQGMSTLQAIWVLIRFFTITTNLGVAILFSGLAIGWPWSQAPRVAASLTLSIGLVGVVYALLLHGSLELSGGSAIANVLLHMITPILVPLYWWLCVEKGFLRAPDPFLFALYPTVYLIYAIVRGQVDGKYPYPFIDVGQLGWWQTAINAAVIAIAYILVAFAFIRLDHKMSERSSARV